MPTCGWSRWILGTAVLALATAAWAQSFTEPTLIDPRGATDDVAASEGQVHIACGPDGTCVSIWHAGTGSQIWAARSTDVGRSWAAPRLVLDAPEYAHHQSVELATDGDGHWVAAWEGGVNCPWCEDVWFTRSDDGDTWSAPARLPGLDTLNVGNGGPSVTSGAPGSFSIASTANETYPSTATNGMLARSTDAGVTWTVSQQWSRGVSRVRIASGADTSIAVWGFSPPLYFARSSDGGATWGPAIELPPTAEEGGGRPVVATDRLGTWIIAWSRVRVIAEYEYYAESESDFLFIRSDDDGLTWSEPAWLNANAETDGRTDDQGLSLEANAYGMWAAVWHVDGSPSISGSDGDLRIAWSYDRGRTWEPSQLLNRTGIDDAAWDGVPDIAAAPGGAWVAVWDGWGLDGNTDSDVYFARADCGCAPCSVCDATGWCVAEPRADCAPLGPSDAAKLVISNPAGTARDRVRWKLALGGGAAAPDLDDPRGDGSVGLCIYQSDGRPILRSTAQAGFACGKDSCWTKSGDALSYDRVDGLPDGVVRANSRRGADGTARIAVVGQSNHLLLPSLPLSGPLVTQLQVDGGQCWQVDFPESAVRVNRPRRFLAQVTGSAP